MPEGPEVLRFADNLRAGIPLDTPCDTFPGYVSSTIFTKGKVLIIQLINPDKDDMFILTHFGLTGEWSDIQNEYSRKYISFAGKSFYYNDKMNIGKIEYYSSPQLLQKLNNLGPDIFGELLFNSKPTNEQCSLFKSRFEKKARSQIGNVINNQEIISGVGNYIRSEALYLAQIHPMTPVSQIDEKLLMHLYMAIIDVAKTSYLQGGKEGYNYRIYGKKITSKNEKVETILMGGQQVYFVQKAS